MTEILPEVISLIRFSTIEQTAQGKAGVEGQRRINELAAEFHGVKIVSEYVVKDVSGRDTANDPQFNAMFAEMEQNRKIIGVVGNEQSRFARPEGFDDWHVVARFQRMRKLIFTPTGRIDPNTPEGRMALTMGGFMSGEELINFKNRTARGKMIKRLEGKNAGGDQVLPRGFRFVRERNEIGKVIGCHWEQDAIEMVRMQRAFELLLANEPYSIIARKTGGYGSGTALKRAMQNPIWVGIRRYEWEAGDKYDPKPTTKNPHPKPRRRSIRRTVPLDVPTFEELRNGTALPIVKPIMSLESWDICQTNIAAREGIVRKTRPKDERKPRFLGMGLTYCSCGELMYFRYGSEGRSHLDRYYCKSQYPHGPGCGAPSIHREELDGAIESFVSIQLLQPKFISEILETVASHVSIPDAVRIGIEKAKARLESGRREFFEMIRHGEMTRKQFNEQISLLETELRQQQALLPDTPAPFDPEEFLKRIAITFAEFNRLKFREKREILKNAVKAIMVDSTAGTITSVTLSGGWMAIANGKLRGKAQLAIRPVPDVTMHLSQPYEIPDTFVDGRGKWSRERLQ